MLKHGASTVTWRQQDAALRVLAVVQLATIKTWPASDDTTQAKAKYILVCFPDMKHILDNCLISDVRLTTGSNWSRNLGGQYGSTDITPAQM